MTAASITLLVVGILLVIFGVLLLVVKKLQTSDSSTFPKFQGPGRIIVEGPLGLVVMVIGILCVVFSPVSYKLGGTSGSSTLSASPTVPHSASPTPTSSSPSPASPASSLPNATITNPPDGASNIAAHKNLQLSGTVGDIPSGYRLDLVLQFVNVDRYYIAADPRTAFTSHDGKWSAPIFVGDPGSIIIRLVMLSPSEIAYVDNPSSVPYQNGGFPALPGTALATATYTAH